MNGRTAKKLRRLVYGDMSLKVRTYKKVGRTILATGVRGVYQATKRTLREVRAHGK